MNQTQTCCSSGEPAIRQCRGANCEIVVRARCTRYGLAAVAQPPAMDFSILGCHVSMPGMCDNFISGGATNGSYV